MTKEIKCLVNQYSETIDVIEELNAEKRELLNSIIPEEIREKIDEIEFEYSERIKLFEETINTYRERIKEAVINAGVTVKGDKHMAVYVKPRVSWNDAFLMGLAATIPSILEARKEGSPSIQIKEIK